MTYTVPWASHEFSQGSIVVLDGKRWKVGRKGSTAVAITRHYWFDDVIDWIAAKLGQDKDEPPRSTSAQYI
jgi:hypothetical protein